MDLGVVLAWDGCLIVAHNFRCPVGICSFSLGTQLILPLPLAVAKLATGGLQKGTARGATAAAQYV